jgi:hypothetical protein
MVSLPYAVLACSVKQCFAKGLPPNSTSYCASLLFLFHLFYLFILFIYLFPSAHLWGVQHTAQQIHCALLNEHLSNQPGNLLGGYVDLHNIGIGVGFGVCLSLCT